MNRRRWRRRPRPVGRQVVVHLTTTDMSLDWLLAPQLVAFGEAGYEVIGMSASGPHVERLESLGIRHVAVDELTRSNDLLSDVRAFVALVRALRALEPDILHTHNPKPGVLGRIAGWLTRTPLVVNTQHGLWAQPTDRRRRRWPVYAAERVAAAFGDVELVQNPEDVTTLIETLHVPADRVRLLGNGIDLERFDPDTIDRRANRTHVRHSWGVGVDEVVCLVVGRLVREKGVEELLETASRLAPVARFVIVGPTDDDKSDAIDMSETTSVLFAGRRDDMPECYAAADIFVTASWREGFPRSAMEAAAMGLPTVATDVRGNRQVVADGETGVLARVRDPDSLCAAIVGLVSDHTLRDRMGAAARERAVRHFDQRTVIARTLAAYRLLS